MEEIERWIMELRVEWEREEEEEDHEWEEAWDDVKGVC